jgi:hypothetical protein
VTRRQSRILIAAAVWTLYVWISRIVIMAGQDESTGFKVVHGILALVSIGFALALGKMGWEARGQLRRSAARPGDPAAGPGSGRPADRAAEAEAGAAGPAPEPARAAAGPTPPPAT